MPFTRAFPQFLYVSRSGLPSLLNEDINWNLERGSNPDNVCGGGGKKVVQVEEKEREWETEIGKM